MTAVEPARPLREDDRTLYRRVAEDALRGERRLYDGLNQYQRDLVTEWLAEALETGSTDNAISRTLWDIDYVRRPVDVVTFLEDSIYLGANCKNVADAWKTDLSIVFAPDSKIYEWIMTGSIGCGKTTVAMAAHAYVLYRLSCLRDPSKFYGQLHGSAIVLGLYSVTKAQAAETGYLQLMQYLDESPYFRDEFPRDPKLTVRMRWGPTTGKNIEVIHGSRGLHAIGRNIFTFSMDEANFMQTTIDRERDRVTGQAYQLYNDTRSRIKSRFLHKGVIPGIMLLMSSRSAQTSFLEERIKDTEDQETRHLSAYALWDIHGHRYSKNTFSVELGDRLNPSRVLKDGEPPRPGTQVVKVPEDFHDDFTNDTDQALRDIAGIATDVVSPLISDGQSVQEAYRDQLEHPFKTPDTGVTVESIELNYLDDSVYLDDFFDIDTTCKVDRGKWVLRLNPDARRYIHVDLALTGDCAGLAMGHVSGFKEVQVRNTDDGTLRHVVKPMTMIDLMLRIVPPKGSEIDLGKIRSFIIYLNHLYQIDLVTFDGFQSRDSMQTLRKVGINAQEYSVDKTAEAYMSLRAALSDRRFLCYRYPPFEDEVLALHRSVVGGKIKVDHPPKGSKDVADAVASVHWHCLSQDTTQQHGRRVGHKPNRIVDPALASAKKNRGVRVIRTADGRSLRSRS